ncbi:putative pectate lyase 5 isoform X2 [Tasmannia lanceolata]|uniref:putative pectate lyase 5 isoform X2 n=1 Tax=Tasmannia lanceolata TaxID=3420 RepID=UPI004063E244
MVKFRCISILFFLSLFLFCRVFHGVESRMLRERPTTIREPSKGLEEESLNSSSSAAKAFNHFEVNSKKTLDDPDNSTTWWWSWWKKHFPHKPQPPPQQQPSPKPQPHPKPQPPPQPTPKPQPPPQQQPSPTASCGTGNPIDDCWRCDPNWDKSRKKLADCAIGFGKDAKGGKDGEFYVVTDPSDNATNPKPGTLRYGVIQFEPLWIIFESDMVIKLQEELIMNSYKTIDGRGANVHITGGPCITVQYITNIIIHGIHVHDCIPAGNASVISTPTHTGHRGVSDGDGISLFGAQHVWIDHCSLSRCTDGLIDAIEYSTDVTISNNYFTEHNEVMLFGAHDSNEKDRDMQITVALNHFGEGLVQRMPCVRFGYVHVVNNDYTRWEMYAIGGRASPTIYSQGNRFLASSNLNTKEVTKRMVEGRDGTNWRNWNWKSEGDLFLNGAYFIQSGIQSPETYEKPLNIKAMPASMVPTLTADAGALSCRSGVHC